MKIHQIISEMTTAGAVATVSMPMGKTRKRTTETVNVAGLEPAEKVMKGNSKKKGPYQNSLSEGKMKDLSMDLRAGKDGLSDADFKKKYGKTKEEMRKSMNKKPEPVKEAKLDEDDIIVVPGQGMKRKTGFVQHGQSRVDHEVEMARSDVLATMKNAKAIYHLLKDRSEEEGIEGWVQEKLIKANDYLNAVKEYYDEKMMQEMTGGVIAGGGVGEGLTESLKLIGRKEEDNRKVKIYKDRDWNEYIVRFYEDGVHLEDADFHTDDLDDAKHTALKFFERLDQNELSEANVNEKALSKAQQKFFGMAHAMQKGKKIPGASKELKDVVKSMKKKDVEDFAKTKHKGLPQHVAKKD